MNEKSQLLDDLMNDKFTPAVVSTTTVDYDKTVQLIRDARKALHLTVAQLAFAAKVDYNHLNAVERGEAWSMITFTKVRTALRRLLLIQRNTSPQGNNP